MYWYLVGYKSGDGQARYERTIAERPTSDRGGALKTAGDITVLDVLDSYWWGFGREYYSGPFAGERQSLEDVLGFLCRQYGQVPAVDFGPPERLAVIEKMRSFNRWIPEHLEEQGHRIFRVFEWAVANGLLSPAAWERRWEATASGQGTSEASWRKDEWAPETLLLRLSFASPDLGASPAPCAGSGGSSLEPIVFAPDYVLSTCRAWRELEHALPVETTKEQRWFDGRGGIWEPVEPFWRSTAVLLSAGTYYRRQGHWSLATTALLRICAGQFGGMWRTNILPEARPIVDKIEALAKVVTQGESQTTDPVGTDPGIDTLGKGSEQPASAIAALRKTLAVAARASLAGPSRFDPTGGASHIEKEPSQRWQYKVLQLEAAGEDVLNQNGASGWELVAIADSKAYLKKPL